MHAAQRGGSWSARRSSRLDSLGSLPRVRRGLTQGEMRNMRIGRTHAHPHARGGVIDHVRPPPAFYRTVLRASNPTLILRFVVRRPTSDAPGRWAIFPVDATAPPYIGRELRAGVAALALVSRPRRVSLGGGCTCEHVGTCSGMLRVVAGVAGRDGGANVRSFDRTYSRLLCARAYVRTYDDGVREGPPTTHHASARYQQSFALEDSVLVLMSSATDAARR